MSKTTMRLYITYPTGEREFKVHACGRTHIKVSLEGSPNFIMFRCVLSRIYREIIFRLQTQR